MSEVVGIAACGCCVAFSVFLIVLLSTSMKTVDQTEWALKYNWWSATVDDAVIATPGMHWVGMGNCLIKYPNYYQLQRFNLVVRTFDGLSLVVDVEFTYRLQQANLKNLYMFSGPGTEDMYPAPNEFNTAYVPLLQNVATGVLDNLATLFAAKMFYLNRTYVATTFKEGLTTALSESLYMDVLTLQLQNSVMPQAYTQAILRTSMLDRNISVAEQERKTRVIQMETQKQMAQKLAQKTIKTAQGKSASILAGAEAHVAQYSYGIQKEAEGFKKSLDYFQAANPTDTTQAVTDFMSYMDVRAMQDHAQGSKTIKIAR